MGAIQQVLLGYGATGGGGGGSYAYWNPSDKDASVTLSDSDKVATSTTGTSSWVRSVTSKSAGKWRVQFVIDNFVPTQGVGFATAASIGGYLGGTAAGWAYWGNYSGNALVYHNGGATGFTPPLATADRFDLLLDIDGGKAWWRKNGTVISGDPVAGTGPMTTFTPGITLFMACDCFGVDGATRLRTNPSEIVDSPVSGFTDGWPI